MRVTMRLPLRFSVRMRAIWSAGGWAFLWERTRPESRVLDPCLRCGFRFGGSLRQRQEGVGWPQVGQMEGLSKGVPAKSLDMTAMMAGKEAGGKWRLETTQMSMDVGI